MPAGTEDTALYVGRHLSLVQRGSWEYATRNTKRPAVGVVAITHDDKVVLVEQHRSPVGRRIVELPAGLAGDNEESRYESLLDAARRELHEETGYIASEWTELGSGYSSPGLTDEEITLFLAKDLQKDGPGGGDGSENITIHEIARDNVVDWLNGNRLPFDLKLLAGLYAAQQHLENGGGPHEPY